MIIQYLNKLLEHNILYSKNTIKINEFYCRCDRKLDFSLLHFQRKCIPRLCAEITSDVSQKFIWKFGLRCSSTVFQKLLNTSWVSFILTQFYVFHKFYIPWTTRCIRYKTRESNETVKGVTMYCLGKFEMFKNHT